MNVRSLLAELWSRGVELSAVGNRLQYCCPTGALTADLRRSLKQYKPALLALLRGPVGAATATAASTPAPQAGITYCPGCRSSALERHGDTTRCDACGAWWVPSIDLAEDAPEATIRIRNPQTGAVLTVGIYRCPQCRETRWGPRLDDPETWVWLTCAGVAAEQDTLAPDGHDPSRRELSCELGQHKRA